VHSDNVLSVIFSCPCMGKLAFLYTLLRGPDFNCRISHFIVLRDNVHARACVTKTLGVGFLLRQYQSAIISEQYPLRRSSI
jgi:hypothetical protein